MFGDVPGSLQPNAPIESQLMSSTVMIRMFGLVAAGRDVAPGTACAAATHGNQAAAQISARYRRNVVAGMVYSYTLASCCGRSFRSAKLGGDHVFGGLGTDAAKRSAGHVHRRRASSVT